MRTRRVWGGASFFVAVAMGGCGGAANDGALDQTSSGIASGVFDATDTAVVGMIDVVSRSEADLCSGALVAQNAVLTARHCVSDVQSLVNGNVECSIATVGAVRAVDRFFVTTSATFSSESDFRRVREILTPTSPGDDLCGRDFALVILADEVPSSVATPLVPSLSGSVQVGTSYSAIGYGATGDQVQDAGTRRRRDGLQVRCLGTDCGTEQILAGEFAGDVGLCPGDSGGPALDEGGQIIGIASRSGTACSLSIYGTPLTEIEWLRSAVKHAADLDGRPPPDWTNQPMTPPPLTQAGGNGGCSLRSSPGAGWPLVALCALALFLARRRRR